MRTYLELLKDAAGKPNAPYESQYLLSTCDLGRRRDRRAVSSCGRIFRINLYPDEGHKRPDRHRPQLRAPASAPQSLVCVPAQLRVLLAAWLLSSFRRKASGRIRL